MTRSKVKLAFIENITERKASYKKRQKGYMKKAQELSTLCDVEAATVVYSPYHDEPMVFPNHVDVTNTFTKFRELPELDKSKNMMTLKGFTKKRIKKLEDQLRKVRKENRVKEFTNMMYDVLNGKDIPADTEPYDLNDLSYVINQNLKRVREAIKMKTRGEDSTSNSPQPIVGLMVPGETRFEVLSSPLLDHPVVPSMVSSERPRAPLLVPNVAPISVVPPMDPYMIPSSAPTQVLQQMFQSVAPYQTVPLMGLSSVPPPQSPSFLSQIFPPMVSQLCSPITQQMALRRASEIAPPMPPTTMVPPMPPTIMASLMTSPIEPSLNAPLMGASIPMNNYQSYIYDFPESPGFAEILNWNNDDLVTLFDDLSFNNINVQDLSHNNNNYF